MKFILLLVFFFFCTTSWEQSIQWQKNLGSSGVDGANCIKQTIDGGYIIAGSASSNDGDVMVISEAVISG